MNRRSVCLLSGVYFLIAAIAVPAEVVSSYVVNGQRLFSGTSYQQMRDVAGAPRAVHDGPGRDRRPFIPVV